MGVHINTDNLSDTVIPYLKQCKQKLKDCKTNLKNAEKVEIILPGLDGANELINILDKVSIGTREIIDGVESNLNSVKDLVTWIKDKIDSFETAESNARDVSSSIAGSASVAGISGSTSSGTSRASAGSSSGSSSISSGSKSKKSTSTKVEAKIGKVKEAKQISSKASKLEEGIGNNITDPEEMQKVIPDEPATSVGIIGEAFTKIETEPEEINSETQTVIEMIYGKDAELTDEEKQTVVNAVENIDKTGVLNGLDEETANQIKAQIVKDGMENKYDLNNITNETLQEYIASQPDLNVQFELKEAKENFDTLINNGTLTQEQVNAVTEKVQIYDIDEEFMKAYQNAGGTETDISNVQAFYDSETQQMHIRNTADSKAITEVMIEAVGEDNLFYDEITNQVAYDHSQSGSAVQMNLEKMEKNDQTTKI